MRQQGRRITRVAQSAFFDCASRRGQGYSIIGWLKRAAIFASLSSIMLPAQSHAASPVDLQLEAPLGCPNRAAILSALDRLVQRAPAAPLRVSARFLPDQGRWVLYASIGNGQRVVAGDSCVAVAEALVVIVALAIDPNAKVTVGTFPELEHSAATPSGSSTASTRPVVVAYPGLISAAPQPMTNHDHSLLNQSEGPARIGLSFLMMTEVGTMPQWSLGPSLFVRYGRRNVWGELSATGLYPRWVATAQDPNKGGHLGWFAGQLGGCWMPGRDVPIGGCAGAELGDLIGRGSNVALVKTAHALWVAPVVSAVFRAKLHPAWALEGRLGLAVPALRPDFGLEGYGRLFSPSLVSLRVSVGFAWR
jgi:hypothetical protein